MASSDSVLLFDGVCNLCNRVVDFVILRDKDKMIRFAALQSIPGKELAEKFKISPGNNDTVVYISDGKAFVRSSAVLHILKDIGGGWEIMYGFIIIPSFVRDFFYDIIAKRRYRIFGKRDTCMVPSEETRERFLTAKVTKL
jgi:predicted DCC family thiol-disulfide oxidoreductase YuxK